MVLIPTDEITSLSPVLQWILISEIRVSRCFPVDFWRAAWIRLSLLSCARFLPDAHASLSGSLWMAASSLLMVPPFQLGDTGSLVKVKGSSSLPPGQWCQTGQATGQTCSAPLVTSSQEEGIWPINHGPLSPAIQRAAYPSRFPPIQTTNSKFRCMNMMGDNIESLDKVYPNCTHIIKAEVNEIQCSSYIHSCAHFIREGQQAGWVWFACVKLCWGLSFFFMCPEMDSVIFPETETRLICQSFPKICFCFFKTIIYNNLFHMLLHTNSHLHTWHNLCKILSPLSCGHFLIISVNLKLFGGSRGVEWEMLMFLWRELLLQTAGNSNPITILSAPTAETQPCPLKPVQVQQCWTRRSGSAGTVTSCCKHVQDLPTHSVHPLPQIVHQKQLTGKEKDKPSKVHSVYCRKWNTSTHLVYDTPLKHIPTHTQRVKKRVCVRSLSTYQEDLS